MEIISRKCNRRAKGGKKKREGGRRGFRTGDDGVLGGEDGEGAATEVRPRLRPASCEVAKPREVVVAWALVRRSGALALAGVE